ncbi:hypothetical protein AArcSl_0065 [Halalkaliarchaeum desulfuricum]|uniref:Uncharacterized protein n=1 Tax=Halalkaliarchaeum desulfuricum TaxID=2055893 RepID=A0A343TF51_9EURY|nr:DUF5789 family protein [Halalkaliarchaeum desulfuricum]AUX07723.1 hypothetical protein AArcSl_0065 [Halalkaliarchaeum desulfuricum]
MSDEESEEPEEPTVELGEGPDVEGAPLSRVASRLTWPQTKSDVEAQEGDAEIRTPDGPTSLSELLEDVDETYFDSRQAFVAEIEAAAGRGPVATE